MTKLLFINKCILVALSISVGLTQTQFNINNLLDYGDLKFAPNNPKPYTGKVFDLHENGMLKMEGLYSAGKKHGRWAHYNSSGKLLASNIFRIGEFKGDTLFTVKDNWIFSREAYKNGFKNGESIHYYEDGSISKSINYLNDVIDGLFTVYDIYGNVFRNIKYRNDIKIKYEECPHNNTLYIKKKLEPEAIVLPYQPINSSKFLERFVYSFNDSTQCYNMKLDDKGKFIIKIQEEFIDEDYEEFESDFFFSDDWEDWDAPPPPDEGGDSEFVAYDKAPLAKSGRSIFNYLEYPKLAIEMKLEGKVFIKFFVDKKGKVRQNSIQMIRGNPVFEEAAITAVSKSEWRPAMQRDMKVGVWMTVPVPFILEDGW